MAPRLFYDLHHHDAPGPDLFIRDGGLAKWRAQGGAVTEEPTPPPANGTLRVGTLRDEVRARLPEIMAASGDRSGHVLVEAPGADHHDGAQNSLTVPGTCRMRCCPSEDFYAADQTFRSPD